MNKYIKYFLYVIEHKINVFKYCWKRGLYLHAFTHDLSKFLPDEFCPYVNWFHGKFGKGWEIIFDNKLDKEGNEQLKKDMPIKNSLYIKNKNDFNKACNKHYKRNKHHWQNPKWYTLKSQTIKIEVKKINSKKEEIDLKNIMPKKYIIQMICDWEGMSLKFGDTAKEYYEKNKHNIHLHTQSKKILEKLLNII
jgi:hypothetical protein